MRIYWTCYSFTEPDVIAEDLYSQLKEQLDLDPSFDFEPSHASFKEKFPGWYLTIKICLIALATSLVISLPLVNIDGLKEWGKEGFGYFFSSVISFIGGAAMLTLLGVLTMGGGQEMSSYGEYTSHKRKYYALMKKVFLSTDSYGEFCQTFYVQRGKTKKRKAHAEMKKRQPTR